MTRMGLSRGEQAALANHKQPEKQMIQIDHDALLEELQAHVAADKLVKGSYWEDGKGCAVGCTLHSYARIIGKRELEYGNHSLYDDFLGPGGHMLGRLEDCIFEGMANEDAREWPERFLRSALGSIRRGGTLQLVGWKFLYWLLTDKTVNPGISNPLVRDAIRQCADVLVPLTKGDPVDESAARSAQSAARSAQSAARSAESAARSAESAARSAESAARSAESAARSAQGAARSAESAARSAESAARSAQSAAWSAAWSAESAESAAWSAAWSAERVAWSAESAESAAWSAAWSAERVARSAESAERVAYKLMSDKLVQLMDAA